jgi:hypothetical protein
MDSIGFSFFSPVLSIPRQETAGAPVAIQKMTTAAWHLSREQDIMPFRNFAPVAGVLGVEMRGEARA